MSTHNPVLTVQNLTKTYHLDKEESLQVRALQGVSLAVDPGEFVAVVGVSGSGKSTLIHCVGSFEAPDPASHDAIQFRKPDGWRSIWHEADWYRQNFIGVVFQAFHLLPNLRVWQNVEIPLMLTACERFTPEPAARRQAVRDVLAQLHIEGLENKQVSELSGGERQRVAIARALIKGPHLLLADEPTGNLDRQNKEGIVQLLSQCATQGVAVLMVTHDEGLAGHYVQRIVRLEDGQLCSDELTGNAPPGGPSRPSTAGQVVPVPPAAREATPSRPSDRPNRAYTGDPAAGARPAVPLPARALAAHVAVPSTLQPVAGSASAYGMVAELAARGPEDGGGLAHRLKQWSAGALRRVGTFRLPHDTIRLGDLAAFAGREIRESSVSLITNVLAIFVGTALTALLLALVFGAKHFLDELLPTIPGINAVHVGVDYSTGAAPITAEEFETLTRWPEAHVVLPNIKQLAILYQREVRETIGSLVSAQSNDPETTRLQRIAGTLELDPAGWDIVLTESVAKEIDNFNPLGLVGQSITLELRRYAERRGDEKPEPSQRLQYPVRVVGIVANSPQNRIYGSLNMVRFVRDFSTMRTEYSVEAGEPIDVTQISPRTMFEGVRLHFRDPRTAERAFTGLKSGLDRRFDVYWPGQEYLYLRDVELMALLVFLGIGILTVSAGSISIFNTLRASVLHKTQEIGILRALGFTRVGIFAMFIMQSVCIGVLAGVAGLLVAWFLNGQINTAVQAYWRLKQLFLLPVHIALAVFLGVLFICVLAALVPSWQAAQRTPMDAIRETAS